MKLQLPWAQNMKLMIKHQEVKTIVLNKLTIPIKQQQTNFTLLP